MSQKRKIFWVWLSIMVVMVTGLTIIGYIQYPP